MREVGKGALAGLTVGLVQAVLWAMSASWDGHSGVRGPFSLEMTVAVFLTGAVVTALVRLPRWPLVAFAGGVATLALGQALWRVAPESTVYGFERWLLGGVHLLAAAGGFVVAVWVMVGARRWWSRIAMLGVLAASCVLAVSLGEPAWRWHLARGFELLGVPLVAPHISGYRDSWEEGSGHCRAVSPDRWVRYGREGRVAVFGQSDGALVQLESHAAEEAVLLAAVETIRPISAESLAEQVHPVR